MLPTGFEPVLLPVLSFFPRFLPKKALRKGSVLDRTRRRELNFYEKFNQKMSKECIKSFLITLLEKALAEKKSANQEKFNQRIQ